MPREYGQKSDEDHHNHKNNEYQNSSGHKRWLGMEYPDTNCQIGAAYHSYHSNYSECPCYATANYPAVKN